MSDLRTAAQRALDALEQFRDISDFTPASAVHAITALRAALAEPEQSVEQALEALNKMQSIGLMMADGRHPRDVLRSFIHGAAPTPRKPVELTDEELRSVYKNHLDFDGWNYERAIIAAYEAKNGITGHSK